MNRTMAHYVIGLGFVLSLVGNVVSMTHVKLSDVNAGTMFFVFIVLVVSLFFLGVGKRNYLRQAYEFFAPSPDPTSYSYIDGEREAFAALIAATRRAESHVRATRFFPMPIRPNQPEYAETIRKRVLGLEGLPPLQHYSRIIAANNREKLNDIAEYIEQFRGYPFTLYVVARENDFELVVIDEAEVFIHFYGTGRVIASTLHLRGKEIAKKFIKIFDRQHDPKKGPVVKIECRYIVDDKTETQKLNEVNEFFDVHCPPRGVEPGRNSSLVTHGEHTQPN